MGGDLSKTNFEPPLPKSSGPIYQRNSFGVSARPRPRPLPSPVVNYARCSERGACVAECPETFLGWPTPGRK
jgi:hypothetical protein